MLRQMHIFLSLLFTIYSSDLQLLYICEDSHPGPGIFRSYGQSFVHYMTNPEGTVAILFFFFFQNMFIEFFIF